jgi:hypothetical protein
MISPQAVAADIRKTLITLQTSSVFDNISLPKVDDRVISYPNSRNIRLSAEDYADRFVEAYSRKDYICRIFDGSLLRVYFRWDDRGADIVESSLAYLPNPGLEDAFLRDVEDVVDPDEKELYLEEAKRRDPVSLSSASYVRVDTCSDSYEEMIHPFCHVHFGLKGPDRICVSRVPLFSEFVDLILYLFYRDVWIVKNKCTDKNYSTYTQHRKDQKEAAMPFALSSNEQLIYQLTL